MCNVQNGSAWTQYVGSIVARRYLCTRNDSGGQSGPNPKYSPLLQRDELNRANKNVNVKSKLFNFKKIALIFMHPSDILQSRAQTNISKIEYIIINPKFMIIENYLTFG